MRAREAIAGRIAAPLFDGDVLAAAAGIRQVIDSQMADLIRKVTLERGYDPRDFAMMAYGGCGPAHAGSYGADVGATEIIIPFFATVHSAVGAALSDTRFSLRHSEPIVLPVDPARLEAIYADDGARRARASSPPRRSRPSGAPTAAGSRRASDGRFTTSGSTRRRASTSARSPRSRRRSSASTSGSSGPAPR